MSSTAIASLQRRLVELQSDRDKPHLSETERNEYAAEYEGVEYALRLLMDEQQAADNDWSERYRGHTALVFISDDGTTYHLDRMPGTLNAAPDIPARDLNLLWALWRTFTGSDPLGRWN